MAKTMFRTEEARVSEKNVSLIAWKGLVPQISNFEASRFLLTDCHIELLVHNIWPFMENLVQH
jgi:hypothetical protein